jgi:hypothetical protein
LGVGGKLVSTRFKNREKKKKKKIDPPIRNTEPVSAFVSCDMTALGVFALAAIPATTSGASGSSIWYSSASPSL